MYWRIGVRGHADIRSQLSFGMLDRGMVAAMFMNGFLPRRAGLLPTLFGRNAFGERVDRPVSPMPTGPVAGA